MLHNDHCGDTNFPTYAADQAIQLSYMQKLLSRKSTAVPAQSKARNNSIIYLSW